MTDRARNGFMISRPKDWWLAKAQSEPEVPASAGAPEPSASYMEHRPTLAERFWRRVGYRYQLTELPEESEKFPGWALTNVRLTLSIVDRLRLLISGRVQIDVRQAMDVPVDTVISAASVLILYPGSKAWK